MIAINIIYATGSFNDVESHCQQNTTEKLRMSSFISIKAFYMKHCFRNNDHIAHCSYLYHNKFDFDCPVTDVC